MMLSGDRPSYKMLLNLPPAESREFEPYGACSFGPNPDDPKKLYIGSGTNRLGGIYHRSQSHLKSGADREEPGTFPEKASTADAAPFQDICFPGYPRPSPRVLVYSLNSGLWHC